MLRPAVIDAAAPLLQDVVIAGQDRDYIGVLAWPNVKACRDKLGVSEREALPALLRSSEIVEHIRAGFQKYNRTNSHSSSRVARVLLMTEPPSIDANEITDKGYINRAATLERRSGLVERLYADPPDAEIIVI